MDTADANVFGNLKEFARVVIEGRVFGRERLDGGDIQDLAIRLGLLIETKYDPAAHGEHDACESGDDWYELAPFLSEHPEEAK